MRHPREVSGPEATSFLKHLEVKWNVSASTHSRARSAIAFLYHKVLGIELRWLDGAGGGRHDFEWCSPPL